MKNLYIASLLVISLILSLATANATARTWHVPTEAPTIAVALYLATAGDVVELECGTYFEHDLVLKAGVVVRSEDGVAACATIDAQQQGRVFLAQNLAQPAVLLGLTITGGITPVDEDFGGGIYCQDASLNMAQCEVQGNHSEYSGAGLFAQRGTLIFSNTVFSENVSGTGGGGAARLAEVDGEFLDCRFEDNVGVDGAALFMSRTSLALTFCTFLNNEAQFFGGAIFCVTDSEPILDHCTLVGNTAHLGGGMMVADNSAPTIDACIVAYNHDGSGIDVHDQGSVVTVICSDVHGNEDGGYSGYLDDQTGLDGNIDADPMFCDLAGGDLSLANISPCLPQNNDCGVLMGAHLQGCVITPVSDIASAAVLLERNRPNPFNPSTTIGFELDAPMEIELGVYDLAGRRVSVLKRGWFETGRHHVIWRGDDDRGRSQPSGTYLYRLRAGGHVETRAMELVR